MDATPILPGRHGAGGLAPPLGATEALGRKWSALHDAADVVGDIAGNTAEPLPAAVRDFPAAIQGAGGWRRELAEQGIEDLTAIMEPGLSALLAAHARGVSPTAAAQALWREFTHARDALLTLATSLDR